MVCEFSTPYLKCLKNVQVLISDYLLEVNLDRDEDNETSIKIRESLKEWTRNIIHRGLLTSQSKQVCTCNLKKTFKYQSHELLKLVDG